MTAAPNPIPTARPAQKDGSDLAIDLRAIRAAMGLSREKLARILDVSAKTVERWEARGTVPPVSNRALNSRLYQLREIVDLGTIVYTADGFRFFLKAKMPVFDDENAFHLLEHDRFDDVFGALVEDYEGLGY